jgi:hypothetical protein
VSELWVTSGGPRGRQSGPMSLAGDNQPRCPHKSASPVVVLEKPFWGKTFVVVDMSPTFAVVTRVCDLSEGFLPLTGRTRR